ncbi:unnamed protein product [Blepharisma stoltei]|uniref:Uncharacterized protein n=1 Tax=Blepharisma stoltei TaxID=1481888 RepID=A0AAU9IZE3_9CILI|nr:unnamed protein product [Blepharisma stoltei]
MFLRRFFSKKIKIPAYNVRQRQTYQPLEKGFMEPKDYSRISTDFMNRIFFSLKEMLEANPTAKLQWIDKGLKLEDTNFLLEVTKDPKNQEIHLMVGDSVTHSYSFDKNNERWISNRDGHLIDELISREISQKFKGYLNL